MSDEEIDVWERLVEVANRDYDGHLTILKFTTNWRIGFVTPSDRDMIDEMVTGNTFAEAAYKLLFPKR
ncbi:hypothetical protein [Mesorhizobium sp.]|uniref:hypothetical protein n=1 Tax=Mesorhizobium sp. TaxID=1871066 RepID=UPI0011F4DA56|nr:hypothetical protein [Mesorhizobium sp.]TIL33924.1 MAG: hypothetical protein E5Y85_12085 [Mesorhizobium sp.]